MKILITGATGLVGYKLLEELSLRGFDDIRILTRNKLKTKANIAFPVDVKEWDPSRGTIDPGTLTDIDIVFHLAGENVGDGRWSEERKKKIHDSRTNSTNLLLSEIAKEQSKPKKFISASAVGIYGNTKDIEITEESGLANDFLAQVCKDWEENLKNANVEGMKAHVLRTGVVLTKDGGALSKMLPPFKLGAGGRLGSGKQYMSWIHLNDLVNAYIFLMEKDCNHFEYNAVAPNPLSNNDFTKVLGSELGRPTIFPVPSLALKLIFGEMSQILLEGQKVVPRRLINEGFNFEYPTLQEALAHEFSYDKKGEVLYKRYQWVPSEKEKVFTFFSNEKNLEKITPPALGFKVVNMTTDKIQTGTIIDYKLSIHGIPAVWKTKITEFADGDYFIDEQLKGPYTKWVHRHSFKEVKDGTLICDKIVYKVPLGALGAIVAGWFVRKDVNSAFNYRNKTIGKLF